MKRRQSFSSAIVFSDAELGWMHVAIPKRVAKALGWKNESEAARGTVNGIPFRAPIRSERIPADHSFFFEEPRPEPSYHLYLYKPLRIALCDPQPGMRLRLVIENDPRRDNGKLLPPKAGPRALDPPRRRRATSRSRRKPTS